jgi:hypothetical protein
VRGVNSERTKLRRDSVSIMQMRPKGTGLARGRVEGRDLRDLENLLLSQEEEQVVVGSALGKKAQEAHRRVQI